MRAIVVTNDHDAYAAELADVNESELPAGEVTVRIDYSTLNYKDSLAITGISPVIRHFPMVPGIDFAGTVEECSHPDYAAGDRVLLNGWGVGETHWGGFAQKARVSSDWLVPVPDVFDVKQAMAIGTAGYTAMLCVMALQRQGVTPEQGEVLVTGAAGGVGSIAVSLLAGLGFTVVASTGRTNEQGDYLRSLGASEVMDRAIYSEKGRPLAKERWAGAIDTVGSDTLANVCAATRYGGAVAACGLAGGFDLPLTVMPFILRGVTLAGIDSVNCPKARRLEAWARLANELEMSHIELMMQEISLADVLTLAPKQIEGQVRGRVVVDVNA